jgi:hypothetical protein
MTVGLANIEPDARDLLVPFPSELMKIWPISTRVNKPENDDLWILEPVEPQDERSLLWASTPKTHGPAWRNLMHTVSMVPENPAMRVVVCGGGVIGASIAYFLS